MTHHFVMTSSQRIKIIKIAKFGYFSCDIDYNSRTDVFRDPLVDTMCPPAAQHNQFRRLVETTLDRNTVTRF